VNISRILVFFLFNKRFLVEVFTKYPSSFNKRWRLRLLISRLFSNNNILFSFLGLLVKSLLITLFSLRDIFLILSFLTLFKIGFFSFLLLLIY